jgi:membrane protease YdiL (CAAX protease family)
VGWLVSINPLHPWSWNLRDTGYGMLATLPMLAFFFASMRFPLGPLRAIREFLVEHLGPILNQCTWYDLLLVAAMAGLGEEILFRGLLQPWIGLFASNVVFGVVHSVTPLYAVLAALIGAYLGALQTVTNNLWPPVLAHALYDFVAFLAVADEWKRRQPIAPFLRNAGEDG